MADLSKLRRKHLPAPPPLEEASTATKEPETAPAAPPQHYKRKDGRSMRRTGRTLQLATRVSEDFDRRFRQIAERDGLLLAELLEAALASYEREKGYS